MKNECWVTLALSDQDGLASLVLARSIRRTLSTRKITILISENVSSSMEVLMQEIFELVVRFDMSEVGNAAFSKLWLWNSRIWTKCVYLDPTCLMLRDSDQLFETTNTWASGSRGVQSILYPQVFVFEPNTRTFKELLEMSKKGTSVNVMDAYLRAKVSSFQCSPDASCLANMNTYNKSGRELECSIFAFEQYPWTRLLESQKHSALWKEFVDKWMGLLMHEIIPEIQLLDQTNKQFLLTSMDQWMDTSSWDGPATLNTKEMEEISTEMSEAIAVVGMSCRFPNANNAEEFWDVLISGQDPFRGFPADRPRHLENPAEDNGFQAGFLKCRLDEFDAKFFGISGREAVFLDPQQRLLLEVVWESLENASINPQTLRGTNTAVFLGIWKQDYDGLFPNSGLSGGDYHHMYLGNALSATASRLSHFLGLYGPNVAIESGCSSSSSGIHFACESLRRGNTTLAVASGVNLVMNRRNPMHGDYAVSAVLAKDFRCKTFDERADGFARAEGCGAVVLKRVNDAIRSGDNILGILRGTALNNDGPRVSFGKPNVDAQARLYLEALANAHVEPHQVNLIEAHGTGTGVGDVTEMESLGRVYSEKRTEPLYISSVKTNIGHAESCAGIAGLIKVLLCIKHRKLPPHLHLQKLNPRIFLDRIPAKIPLEATEWSATPRIAGLSSFGMSGTNVHLIVQETPSALLLPKSVGCSKPLHMVGISAKSDEALQELRQNYISFLEIQTTGQLDDIAFTLGTGRANMPHRIAVVAEDRQELLAKFRTQDYIAGTATAPKKIIFLFTGQGSQYFGMARNLYGISSIFRTCFDYCDDLYKTHLSIPLHQVLWEDPTLLESTIYCQPAIFCIQVCLLKIWLSLGLRPDFVLGHSVGEFCAAFCSGIYSLEDAMKLVVARSKLVQELPNGKMLVIKTSSVNTCQLIERFSTDNCGSWIDVAAENSDEEVVISGQEASVAAFANFCSEQGVNTQLITASHGFHSRQMDAVIIEFGQIASGLTPRRPLCKYISSTLAREMQERDFDGAYWMRHLRDTVKFQDAVNTLPTTEDRIFIEIGSHPILLGLVMQNISDPSTGTFCPTLRRNEEDVSSILNSVAKLFVAGVDISWTKWYEGGNKISLPNYPFQRQAYWFVAEDSGMTLTPVLNPLLGRQIPSPASDIIFSQHLSPKSLPYLSDHKIGDRLIFPAAAYVEIIMAAGLYVVQCDKGQIPLMVEKFTVDAALALESPTQIQTIVRPVGSASDFSWEIQIHRRVESDEVNQWKRHAVATFSPNAAPNVSTLDVEKVKARLAFQRDMDTVGVYAAIGKSGIQFGPKFQSITHVWGGETELLSQMSLLENSTNYICHPIVIDAMIQTAVFRQILASTDESVLQLQLPISIKKFSWLSRDTTIKMFIRAAWDTNGEASVTLHNEGGIPLAMMEGIELLRTNMTNFLSSLTVVAESLSEFVIDTWKPIGKTGQLRVDTGQFHLELSTFTERALEEVKGMSQTVCEGLDLTDELFFLYLIRAIRMNNWEWPPDGDSIVSKPWENIAPTALHIFKTESIRKMFEARGYLASDGNRYFQVLKSLPKLDELETEIAGTHRACASIVGEEDIYLRFAHQIGGCMPKILDGKMLPLEALFPLDKTDVGADRVYTEAKYMKYISVLTTSLFLDAVNSAKAPFRSDEVLQILEVGAGSGICCKLSIQGLKELSLPFEYTFTDISSSFVNEAKEKFKENIILSVLDIEEDPLTQGFAPDNYDVILASNVIHATANLADTLRNLFLLLRPGGIIVFGELFQERPNLSLSFGFLDGWWRFTDFRNGGPLINQQQWIDVLNSVGFIEARTMTIFETAGAVAGRKSLDVVRNEISNHIGTAHQKLWLFASDASQLPSLLEHKMRKVGRHVTVHAFADPVPKNLEGIIFFWTVYGDDLKVDQEKCERLLHLCQNLIETYEEVKQKPKLILVTRGVNYLTDAGPGNPNAATAHSFLKSFCNENPNFPVGIIDTDQDIISPENEAEEIFAQVWSKEKRIFRDIREGRMLVHRLKLADQRRPPLPLPNSNRFKVMSPVTKSLKDLKISPFPQVELTGENVEVNVRSAALNFRDIFMILRPDGFTVPDHVDANPGLDVAGVVSRVGPKSSKFRTGDEVYAMIDGGGLASHVVCTEQKLMRKPTWMSFPSAAAIPVAFITAFYSFLDCAKLGPDDRVLIHVATGGVGLAAIQVATSIGAEIYATAGSRRKQAHLRAIGIQHVYHSRNTKFKEEILRDTNGAGVTVVLNSLTGPHFKEASLGVCAQGARFVEIGKVNIWTHLEVAEIRPDVAYFVVDMAGMLYENHETLRRQIETLDSRISKRTFKGLPYVAFELERILDAFQYFQEAKHIGKVVINIPQPILSPEGRLTFYQPLFHAESTYLVTGGLGGIGMEVAKWMSERGARKILLTGRSAPTEYNQLSVTNLNKSGCRTVVIHADVGKFRDCQFLLESVDTLNLPPLGGIMHAAGIIRDSIIPNQSWESFEEVFWPKVHGTWNLHTLTLDYNLEFFAMFSSLCSLVGVPGQSNHAAASRFLDSMAHYRHSLGLPSCSINFGGWADVGLAANTPQLVYWGFGFLSFSTKQGLASIEHVLREKLLQMGILQVSSWAAVKKSFNRGDYFDDIQSETVIGSHGAMADSTAAMAAVTFAAPGTQQGIIEKFLEKVLKGTLRIPETDTFPIDQNFYEAGIDSLMAIEFRNRIQTVLPDKHLSLDSIVHHVTIRSLTTHLLSLLKLDVAETVDIEKVVASDSILPLDIQAAPPACQPPAI